MENIVALEEHVFIGNSKKVSLSLNIVNVPGNELSLQFQEFLRRLKMYLLRMVLSDFQDQNVPHFLKVCFM